MKSIYLSLFLLFFLGVHGVYGVHVEISTKKFSTPIYNSSRKFCMPLPILPLTTNFTAQLEITFVDRATMLSMAYFDKEEKETYTYEEPVSKVFLNVHDHWNFDAVHEVGSFYGHFLADAEIESMTIRLFINEKEFITFSENPYNCVGYIAYGNSPRTISLMFDLLVLLAFTLLAISSSCTAVFWYLKRRRKLKEGTLAPPNFYRFPRISTV